MTNIGKDFPKSKRGRPRLLDAECENLFRQFALQGKPLTLRSVQNTSYCGRALKRLGCKMSTPPEVLARFRWLLRPDETGNTHGRDSILYQLGRTRSDVALLIFADRLCEVRPTAEKAIRLLREWQARYDGMLVFHVVDTGEMPDETKLAEDVCRHEGSA